MLTIPGKTTRYCDGLRRRDFLRIGAFAFAGHTLTLPQILRASATKGNSQGGLGHKAIINVFLGGGPPHQDMWDLKMDAPAEIRGEFKPIATSVPGIQICEVFPQLAARMHNCAIIRSLVGSSGGHDAIQCMSGWPKSSMANLGGRPSIGATASKLQGPVDPSVPSFVGLAAKTQHTPWSDSGTPGFLGASHKCFQPNGQGMKDLILGTANAGNFGDRKTLLKSFDLLKRGLDHGGNLSGIDSAQEKALDVLTSSKLLDALDLSKESSKVRDRYGDGKPYQFQYDGAPTVNDQLLMARRLVEAGARVVTLSYGRWDSHGKNFDLVRDHGKKLDQGLSALMDDLQIRGLLDDVTVIAWGEFGRTPRINKDAGRDHWPQVSCAMMFGGGMKTGQVVGSTNRLGEFAKDRPVTYGEVFATLYSNIGLNPMHHTLLDPTGRPEHLAAEPPLKELV
ncbi:MAG: DUF1501 domain-containing protein [Gemmataceae bacterium]|nr:DUF1501 domain-containing protein [Gemmataceae bacterium]